MQTGCLGTRSGARQPGARGREPVIRFPISNFRLALPRLGVRRPAAALTRPEGASRVKAVTGDRISESAEVKTSMDSGPPLAEPAEQQHTRQVNRQNDPDRVVQSKQHERRAPAFLFRRAGRSPAGAARCQRQRLLAARGCRSPRSIIFGSAQPRTTIGRAAKGLAYRRARAEYRVPQARDIAQWASERQVQ